MYVIAVSGWDSDPPVIFADETQEACEAKFAKYHNELAVKNDPEAAVFRDAIFQEWLQSMEKGLCIIIRGEAK